MTGMCFVSGWLFRRRVASQPSIPGSRRSITMSSGSSVFGQPTPSRPLVATLTSNPARLRRLCNVNRLSSLSTTQRILVISDSNAGARLGRLLQLLQDPRVLEGGYVLLDLL